jgi:miniconductance mechanosensitive channel
MQEAGGRRVKRPIYIDIHSIKICDEKLLETISMLDPIMTQAYVKISGQMKRPINVALFRHYMEAYLKQHEGVHKGMKIIIRHLQGPPAAGLLLELYFFTNQTDSERYEAIQADIFEHLYAILPRFDLQILQYPT